jgi:membrane protein implicated in regulation of membrane protease activity
MPLQVGLFVVPGIVALGLLCFLLYLFHHRGHNAGADPGHGITEVSYSLYGGTVGTVVEQAGDDYRVSFDADPDDSSHLVRADTWLRPGERVEVGLWIANVREVDPSETTTRAFSQAGADNAPETEREAN